MSLANHVIKDFDTLQARNAELYQALAHAIKEADSWYSEYRSHETVEAPGLDQARLLLTSVSAAPPVDQSMAWESTTPIYIQRITERQYQAFRPAVQQWYRRIPAAIQAPAITEDLAKAMGAKGAQATEAERLLFEAWMRGHCWAVVGDWNGQTYVTQNELAVGVVDYHAMNTRGLWAAWRDRAALGASASA